MERYTLLASEDFAALDKREQMARTAKWMIWGMEQFPEVDRALTQFKVDAHDVSVLILELHRALYPYRDTWRKEQMIAR